jgi:hypothetical protein
VFSCKNGDLVVILATLVVKITSLVVIVKIWNTQYRVAPTEKGLGSLPKALIHEKKDRIAESASASCLF